MKPEFMRLRRALAGTVAALLLAAGLVVVSPALSASAHHNTITVSASCVNYKWTITWNVANSESDKTETITYSSDPAIITEGTQIGKGATYTKIEAVSGPVDKTLTVTGKWSNGVTHTATKSVRTSDFVGTCAPHDKPKLNAVANGCVSYGTSNGVVSFSLTGVTTSYSVELREGSTVRQTITSSSGPGQFTGVPPGSYTVKAWAGQKSAQTGEFAVIECAPTTPVIALLVAPCVTGGALGAVTATLSDLISGVTYRLTLRSDDGTVLETKDHTATSATFQTSFTKRGPGTYYATVAIGGGDIMASSAQATITDCPDDVAVTVQLDACMTVLSGADRGVTVRIDGLAASTVYTVQLVAGDAAGSVIASTTTPGDSATVFSHTFTGVSGPGEYAVRILGATNPVVSDPVAVALCDLDTLAPPSIELVGDPCDGAGSSAPAPLTAQLIDLDPSSTYYVRIVDGAGAAVTGGADRLVSGAATTTVTFPGVTAPGEYTAQLLIDPDKQLAATSPEISARGMCLPTLALTGPGELLPLAGIAALLLTLGGAVVTGRLRRRTAL